MIYWTITDAEGVIVEPGFATSSLDIHPRDAGFDWIEAEHVATPCTHSIDPLVQQWSGEEWEPNLDAIRALRWQAVKARRDQAEFSGCVTVHGRADTTADSQRKVGGAVQMALIAQASNAPFSIEWTMADNAVVVLDAEGMVAVGLAVGQHVNTCHAVASTKRAEINAAMNVDDIEAVDIDTGWPDSE